MSNRIRKHGEALRAPGIITLVMVCVLALFFIMGASAHAHGVYIFAWVEGDTIYTDSYFSSKKKVKDGVVKVFNSSGDILLEGKTDESGEFSFKIPGEIPLRLVLEAGTGHRGEFLLESDETAGIAETPTSPKISDGFQDPSSPPSHMETDRIRKVVEETLDSRLKPIAKALAESRQNKGLGLTEIIAGIGYIVGIMGIILYFRAKKKP